MESGCCGGHKAVNRWQITLQGIPHTVAFEHGLATFGSHARRLVVDGQTTVSSQLYPLPHAGDSVPFDIETVQCQI